MKNTAKREGNITTRILNEALILFGSISASDLHRTRWKRTESQVLQWMQDAAAMTLLLLTPISLQFSETACLRHLHVPISLIPSRNLMAICHYTGSDIAFLTNVLICFIILVLYWLCQGQAAPQALIHGLQHTWAWLFISRSMNLN